MEAETLIDRITVDPNVLMGKATIGGLRISVEQILKALANNVPAEDLLQDYPKLEPADIQACLAYAALVSPTRLLTWERAQLGQPVSAVRMADTAPSGSN
jgi:uncharacterized protein (DUF433 family)